MSRSIGATMELRAAEFLRGRGLVVVEQNYTTNRGEIDLVCRDGETWVFVEVRARADDEHGDPLETIDRHKRARIILAARTYLTKRQLDEVPCRFDVVTLVGEHITHYEDAFQTTD